VLAPGDGTLQAIGSVGDLGRGETIHSVRFLGEVGYVVTFEQTDPLYTIDLRDPAAPRVTGELKILGYSAYLHPLADGLLVGVGQDATETGRTTGMQVALFDVRDPAAPARVAQATIPGASSAVEWDHHAFLWWAERGLLGLPVSAWQSEPFEGFVAYTIDVASPGITETARLTHPAMSLGGGGVRGKTDPAEIGVAPPDVDTFRPPVQRALVIGDQLWTLSSAGLMATDLDTWTETAFVTFS
jgi:hypothetical protein